MEVSRLDSSQSLRDHSDVQFAPRTAPICRDQPQSVIAEPPTIAGFRHISSSDGTPSQHKARGFESRGSSTFLRAEGNNRVNLLPRVAVARPASLAKVWIVAIRFELLDIGPSDQEPAWLRPRTGRCVHGVR